MKWADRPEDVPVWDHSRGLPVGRNLYWAQYQKNNLNTEEKIIQVLRKTLKKDNWTPQQAPKYGYPRLVWANPFEAGQMFTNDWQSILNDISGLIRARTDKFDLSVSKRIKNEILVITGKYGLLNPISKTQGNTYQAWINFSYYVHAHMESLIILNDSGFSELLEHLKIRKQQWLQDTANEINLLNRNVSPFDQLLWQVQNSTSKQSFIDELLRQLLQSFSYQAKHEIALNLGNICYFVPIRNWVHFQLAQMWLGSGTFKLCAGCHRMFIAYRRDTKYCHDRCRVRKHYKVNNQ